MQNIICLALVIVLSVLSSGCEKSVFSDPVIDASTDEAMKTSIEKIRNSLPEEEAEKFDDALQVLAFSGISMKDIFAEGAINTGGVQSKMRASLDGKTADEVVAEANRVTAEREERQRRQALAEIAELEKKKIESEQAQEALTAFEVLRSRFYLKDGSFRKEPVIELTVLNGTEHAVSRAYFDGIIASPGRSVPWHKDSFNYSIPGGLEPGEQASWSLAPNMFSDWGSVDAPEDAIFTVTVVKLDDAQGEPLFDAQAFSERERERLRELKNRYGSP